MIALRKDIIIESCSALLLSRNTSFIVIAVIICEILVQFPLSTWQHRVHYPHVHGNQYITVSTLIVFVVIIVMMIHFIIISTIVSVS